MFKTIEDFVGNTPRKTQASAGSYQQYRSRQAEGNNPGFGEGSSGAVDDHARLERGDIRPGDTLIDDQRNTGIALAMAAAIMGYPLILVMPQHLNIERRQSMKAYGQSC
jgi:cysteine synthase B